MSHSRRRPGAMGSTVGTLLAAGVLAGLAIVVGNAIARAQLPVLDRTTIPHVAYQAYVSASAQAPTVANGCAVDWTIIAGLGRVESRHGLLDGGHDISIAGTVTPVIRGPQLDGTGGTRPIADTDGGAFDGDPIWDRAMGPLQFIPTTWRELARDGNGDGVAEPDNLYDAALTAVAHLCLRQPGDYSDRAQLRRALLGYNTSGRYADQVLAWIDRYRAAEVEQVVDLPGEAA